VALAIPRQGGAHTAWAPRAPRAALNATRSWHDEWSRTRVSSSRTRVSFSDSSAQDATALALETTELGERHQPLLEELGFDTALLAEARTMAAALRALLWHRCRSSVARRPRDSANSRVRALRALERVEKTYAGALGRGSREHRRGSGRIRARPPMKLVIDLSCEKVRRLFARASTGEPEDRFSHLGDTRTLPRASARAAGRGGCRV
jgi:hypothetical protein